MFFFWDCFADILLLIECSLWITNGFDELDSAKEEMPPIFVAGAGVATIVWMTYVFATFLRACEFSLFIPLTLTDSLPFWAAFLLDSSFIWPLCIWEVSTDWFLLGALTFFFIYLFWLRDLPAILVTLFAFFYYWSSSGRAKTKELITLLLALNLVVLHE